MQGHFDLLGPWAFPVRTRKPAAHASPPRLSSRVSRLHHHLRQFCGHHQTSACDEGVREVGVGNGEGEKRGWE